MGFLILSFIAGVLTVLAPCILPILPVVLGGAAADTSNKRRPIIIIGSLVVSVFVFTLLLKVSTAFIMVPPQFWTYISGGILLIFGLSLLFPETWARLLLKLPGHGKADAWMAKGYSSNGALWGDILIGAALGPIFTTCSPTFFVILATVLPQSFSIGLFNLAAYVVGLGLILLLIAKIGQKLIAKLEWAANPYGWFKKTLGVLFIILAILIATGTEKKIETAILDAGFLDVTKIERSIQKIFERSMPDENTYKASSIKRKVNPGTPDTFVEIKDPSGFVNAEPFQLQDLVGDKVILLDFMTYSCINCQRTFPYLNDWYDKYSDKGLEIVAIHTPEFSFEKDIDNVRKAADSFGLEFPLVLDNNYATWNAYKNRYWPRKYLIDIRGNIVYDHIGEGSYDETEKKIIELLKDRDAFLDNNNVSANIDGSLSVDAIPVQTNQAYSPETYFGAWRNTNFGNGLPGTIGKDNLVVPPELVANRFYLGGHWKVEQEYAESNAPKSSMSDPLLDSSIQPSNLAFVFKANKVFIVAESADGSPIKAMVLIDGKPIPEWVSGKDVKSGYVTFSESRLYELFSQPTPEQHRIDIIFERAGGRVFTFTFG